MFLGIEEKGARLVLRWDGVGSLGMGDLDGMEWHACDLGRAVGLVIEAEREG